jgi:flagellar hook protein FlgE
MIETQQAYTANTKVMSTTDQMLQDAIAMYA